MACVVLLQQYDVSLSYGSGEGLRRTAAVVRREPTCLKLSLQRKLADFCRNLQFYRKLQKFVHAVDFYRKGTLFCRNLQSAERAQLSAEFAEI